MLTYDDLAHSADWLLLGYDARIDLKTEVDQRIPRYSASSNHWPSILGSKWSFGFADLRPELPIVLEELAARELTLQAEVISIFVYDREEFLRQSLHEIYGVPDVDDLPLKDVEEHPQFEWRLATPGAELQWEFLGLDLVDVWTNVSGAVDAKLEALQRLDLPASALTATGFFHHLDDARSVATIFNDWYQYDEPFFPAAIFWLTEGLHRIDVDKHKKRGR